MSNFYDDAPQVDRSRLLLARIAQVLDRPMATFSEQDRRASDQMFELIRLWTMIEQEQDCLKVLAFVRTLAGRAAAQETR